MSCSFRESLRDFLGVERVINGLEGARADVRDLARKVTELCTRSAVSGCTITVLGLSERGGVVREELLGETKTVDDALRYGLTVSARRMTKDLVWFLHAPPGVVIGQVFVAMDLVSEGCGLFGRTDVHLDPAIPMRFRIGRVG